MGCARHSTTSRRPLALFLSAPVGRPWRGRIARAPREYDCPPYHDPRCTVRRACPPLTFILPSSPTRVRTRLAALRLRAQQSPDASPRVVLLGGGTGLHCVLQGLRRISETVQPLDITAVVSTADDGGSTGRLRDELGIPAVGDLRRALLGLSPAAEALADANGTVDTPHGQREARRHRRLQELFRYRLRDAPLRGDQHQTVGVGGHAVGNLLLAALVDMHDGDLDAAVDDAGVLLGVDTSRHRVYPVSVDDLVLVARKEVHSAWKTLEGESSFAQSSGRIGHLACVRGGRGRPSVDARIAPRATARVLEAIERADMIVLGPGSLYTSIGANLVVEDVRRALWRWQAAVGDDDATRRRQRRLVYVSNLCTERGETDGMDLMAHVEALHSMLAGFDLNRSCSAGSGAAAEFWRLTVVADHAQVVDGEWPDAAEWVTTSRSDLRDCTQLRDRPTRVEWVLGSVVDAPASSPPAPSCAHHPHRLASLLYSLLPSPAALAADRA